MAAYMTSHTLAEYLPASTRSFLPQRGGLGRADLTCRFQQPSMCTKTNQRRIPVSMRAQRCMVAGLLITKKTVPHRRVLHPAPCAKLHQCGRQRWVQRCSFQERSQETWQQNNRDGPVCCLQLVFHQFLLFQGCSVRKRIRVSDNRTSTKGCARVASVEYLQEFVEQRIEQSNRHHEECHSKYFLCAR